MSWHWLQQANQALAHQILLLAQQAGIPPAVVLRLLNSPSLSWERQLSELLAQIDFACEYLKLELIRESKSQGYHPLESLNSSTRPPLSRRAEFGQNLLNYLNRFAVVLLDKNIPPEQLLTEMNSVYSHLHHAYAAVPRGRELLIKVGRAILSTAERTQTPLVGRQALDDFLTRIEAQPPLSIDEKSDYASVYRHLTGTSSSDPHQLTARQRGLLEMLEKKLADKIEKNTIRRLTRPRTP